MKKFSFTHAFVFAVLAVPFARAASAQETTPLSTAISSSVPVAVQQQSNVPGEVRQAEVAVESAVKRFRVGVEGAVGMDPELIMFGAHGTFAPIFRRGVEFRPGVEVGVGEVTTIFGINMDVLYTLPGGPARGWSSYIGAGPNFALSHRGFDATDEIEDDNPNRFDFSDTDFEGGVNFTAGARHRNGMYLELKATAYGVSNVRLLVGYNF